MKTSTAKERFAYLMYNHPQEGGVKTKIMANIQTPNRVINVKETYEEVCKAMDFQWIELIEDTSSYGELSGKFYKSERKIRLNRDYIIEVHP